MWMLSASGETKQPSSPPPQTPSLTTTTNTNTTTTTFGVSAPEDNFETQLKEDKGFTADGSALKKKKEQISELKERLRRRRRLPLVSSRTPLRVPPAAHPPPGEGEPSSPSADSCFAALNMFPSEVLL